MVSAIWRHKILLAVVLLLIIIGLALAATLKTGVKKPPKHGVFVYRERVQWISEK